MRQSFRDRWFLVLGSLIFVGLLVGAGVFYRKTRVVAKAPAPAPAPAPQALPTGTELTFEGQVQAQLSVPVPAPSDGVIEMVAVENGAEVFEGQMLARIKNEGLESANAAAAQDLEQSQTRVNNLESSLIAARLEASRSAADSERLRVEFERAEKTANRQQALYREGATARLTYEKAIKEFERAKTEFDAARETARTSQERVNAITADLEASRRALDEKKVTAEATKTDLQTADVHSPVDGVVVATNAKPGDEVDMSMRDLFQIAVDITKLQVPFEPDPKVAEKLQEGQPALVQVLEASAEAFPAEIHKNSQGQFRAEFASADPSIKPGVNATVRVKLP